MTDDARLSERLAARTLELIDIPSESRDEARLAEHVAGVLRGGGVAVSDLGDTCVLAGDPAAPVLLAGHLDTVPAQDNRPGRRDAERVHGLGASDMLGSVAVMIELALAGAPYRFLFFGREELPLADSALTPLLARARDALECDLVVMMEPTDNELHAGCLGNINATWTFSGVAGHSARPWQADNAIEHAARAIAALAGFEPEPHELGGLVFWETAAVTRIAGGIAGNVIPDSAVAHLNYRYPPGWSPERAELRLAELVAGHGSLEVTSNSPSAPVAVDAPLARSLIRYGELEVRPKQAWTPVAEFAAAGLPAVNFGPGEPALAHKREESVRVEALAWSHAVLAGWRSP